MLFAPHSPAIASPDAASSDVPQLSQPSSSTAHQRVNWQGSVVMTNEQSHDCFSIGPDGYVWHLQDALSASPELMPTGLKACSFAVGRDEVGRMVVFAAHGMQLQASVQQPSAMQQSGRTHWNPKASHLWSAPMQLSLPHVDHAVSVARLVCVGEGARLHVGVIMQCKRPNMVEHYEMAVSHWPSDRQHLSRYTQPHQARSNSWTELMAALRQMPHALQAAMLRPVGQAV